MDKSEYEDDGNAAAIAKEWGVDVALLEDLDGQWEIHDTTASDGTVIAHYVEFDQSVKRDLLDVLGVPAGQYSRYLSKNFGAVGDHTAPAVSDGDDGLAKKIDDFLKQGENVDWMLAWVLAHAECYGLEFGVTVNVGGATITGTVISGRKFFERLRASLERADTTNARLTKFIPSSLTQWIGLYPEPGEDADLYDTKPNYLHLDNARYLFGNSPLVPSNGILWRGKIRSVDGFSLGQMHTSSN